MITDLQKQIIITLSYTDQFDFPLTAIEIFTRLITNNLNITQSNVNQSLDSLVNSNFLIKSDFYYLLSNKSKNMRFKRNKYSEAKWLEADEFVKIAKKTPWIKGILITGSLAVNNAKKNDDIDFMIVLTKNRLWLTRLLLIIFASIKGKRRSWSREEKNSWCFNLFIDETELKLDKKLRSIYGAYEVAQAVWLYNRDGVKEKFFLQNNWVKNFIPRYYILQKNNEVLYTSTHNYYIPVISNIIDILNYIAFKAQYLYMKPHMTREKVALNYAFFHPRNTKRKIFANWKTSLMKINL